MKWSKPGWKIKMTPIKPMTKAPIVKKLKFSFSSRSENKTANIGEHITKVVNSGREILPSAVNAINGKGRKSKPLIIVIK